MKVQHNRMDDFVDDGDDVDDDQLLSPHEKEEELKWEIEFQKRRIELEREKTKLEERRRRSCSRLENLSLRWRNLEQRRLERSKMQRTATTLHSEMTSGPKLPERGSTVV